MPTLWALEPSTEAKHRLYKRYLDAWWPILLQRPNVRRVTYVDAFAGPGQYAGGEDGSPVFALERLLTHTARSRMSLTRDRVTLIFIEAQRSRYLHLIKVLESKFGRLSELPVTVVVKHGKAENDTLPLLGQSGAWGSPILAVFDSWGNVGVPWSDLRAIAANTSSEALITFGPNWFSRREGEDPAELDAVFGGRPHWTPSNPTGSPGERWEAWLETYRSAMLRAGFGYCLPFQVVPHTGQPLNLVFGTGHHRAVEAFKDAMWNVDTSDGMRFSDPRTSLARQALIEAIQPSLFEDHQGPDPELLDLVLGSLCSGPKTVHEVRDFLLRDTARWLPKHASSAIKYLVDGGKVSCSPGRLTSESVLVALP